MSCFFGCFRIGDNRRLQRLPVSDPPLSVTRNQDAVVSRNQLSSLFQAQEKGDVDPTNKDNLVRRSGKPSTDGSEFTGEAKFLTSKHSKNEKLPQYYSPPAKSSQLWATAPNSGASPTPSSCVINEQSETHISSSSQDETVDTASTVNLQDGNPNARFMSVDFTARSPHTNKSARLEDESEISPRTCLPNQKSELQKSGDRSVIKSSPYPTPLSFSDDMQTPGTAFVSGNNNNANVRSQYVYTVSDPSENQSYWQSSRDGSSDIDYSMANIEGELSGRPKSFTSSSETSVNQGTVYPEGGLSSWLKPARHDEVRSFRKPRPGQNQEDRPIIGLVATHWREEEEVPRVSPRGWDGKGIPNSTTKYKEDQKVSWHATPFEERLEKALSEESIISERKPLDTEPVIFEVEEENDTATTLQLQSFSNQKSVVSC